MHFRTGTGSLENYSLSYRKPVADWCDVDAAIDVLRMFALIVTISSEHQLL